MKCLRAVVHGRLQRLFECSEAHANHKHASLNQMATRVPYLQRFNMLTTRDRFTELHAHMLSRRGVLLIWRRSAPCRLLCISVSLTACSSISMGQQSSLVDPPQREITKEVNADNSQPEGKRLLGIIPNYRTSPSLQNYKPLTAGEKFKSRPRTPSIAVPSLWPPCLVAKAS